MISLPPKCEMEVLMKIYETLEKGEVAKSTDICKAFSGKKARTTVLTLLSRLEKRGVIITDRTRKVLQYTTTVSKSEIQQIAVNELRKIYFDDNEEEILKFIK